MCDFTKKTKNINFTLTSGGVNTNSISIDLEQFSNECRKTRIKAINSANHNKP